MSRKEEPTRCYLDGVEIDELEPRLPFLDLDDWFVPFLRWVALHHFDKEINAVFTPAKLHGEPMVYSVWVGTPPEGDMVPPEHFVDSFVFDMKGERN